MGGNSLWANLFAAVSGALMYFATLTEVPILQGLIDKCHDIGNPVLMVKSVTTSVTQSHFTCSIIGQAIFKNMNKFFPMIHLKAMDLRHNRRPHI